MVEIIDSTLPDPTPPAVTTATPSPLATPSPEPQFCCLGDGSKTGGTIDTADFVAVQANFNSGSVPADLGNADCSTGIPAVDTLDFVAVQANFNTNCP